MVEDINLLLDNPLLLLFVLGIGAAIGNAVERFWRGIERNQKRAYWAGRKSAFGNRSGASETSASDDAMVTGAALQLKLVMNARFSARPLLNQGERRVLAHLDRILAEAAPGWRAMGQVSLGEILASPDSEAYRAVNSKRVDLLIVDGDCRPLHAVEFQGKGHHLGNSTAARDAVKREALRRAGIGYLEVTSGDLPSDLRALVHKLVRQAA